MMDNTIISIEVGVFLSFVYTMIWSLICVGVVLLADRISEDSDYKKIATIMGMGIALCMLTVVYAIFAIYGPMDITINLSDPDIRTAIGSFLSVFAAIYVIISVLMIHDAVSLKSLIRKSYGSTREKRAKEYVAKEVFDEIRDLKRQIRIKEQVYREIVDKIQTELEHDKQLRKLLITEYRGVVETYIDEVAKESLEKLKKALKER